MIIEILTYIIIGILSLLTSLLIAEVKKQHALGKGVQALLRNELYNIYFRCIKKGYATNVEKNNFENLYIQYHALGRNGVMTTYRKQLLELPTQRLKRVQKKGC